MTDQVIEGGDQHDRPIMVTLANTVYEDLVTIAEHIEVSEGGLERVFEGMDEAQKRTAAITALLDAPRAIAVRMGEATLTDTATYSAATRPSCAKIGGQRLISEEPISATRTGSPLRSPRVRQAG